MLWMWVYYNQLLVISTSNNPMISWRSSSWRWKTRNTWWSKERQGTSTFSVVLGVVVGWMWGRPQTITKAATAKSVQRNLSNSCGPCQNHGRPMIQPNQKGECIQELAVVSLVQTGNENLTMITCSTWWMLWLCWLLHTLKHLYSVNLKETQTQWRTWVCSPECSVQDASCEKFYIIELVLLFTKYIFRVWGCWWKIDHEFILGQNFIGHTRATIQEPEQLAKHHHVHSYGSRWCDGMQSSFGIISFSF